MILLLRSVMIFFATLMAAAFVALANPASMTAPPVSYASPANTSQLMAGADLQQREGATAREASR